jgi:hypothetical protein
MPILIRLIAMLAALLASMSPALAQSPSPRVLQSLRSHFPEEASALSARLAGRSPQAARLLLGEAMERFHQVHLNEILAAPGARLIALETRHGRMLRSLEKRDKKLCAVVGNLGFFSREARSGAPAEGLDDYSVALIEAAAAGRGRAAPRAPSQEEVQAWLAEAERRGPEVPVRAMLRDRQFRASAGDHNLCVGAALLHEAAAALPSEQAAAVSASLVRSVLGATIPSR